MPLPVPAATIPDDVLVATWRAGATAYDLRLVGRLERSHDRAGSRTRRYDVLQTPHAHGSEPRRSSQSRRAPSAALRSARRRASRIPPADPQLVALRALAQERDCCPPGRSPAFAPAGRLPSRPAASRPLPLFAAAAGRRADRCERDRRQLGEASRAARRRRRTGRTRPRPPAAARSSSSERRGRRPTARRSAVTAIASISSRARRVRRAGPARRRTPARRGAGRSRRPPRRAPRPSTRRS